MNLPATRHRLGLVGILALLLGPLSSPSQACLIPWTAGYGHSSCCLSNLFGCCGLFGGSGYSAAYAPTYQYAPSYGAPWCDPCGGSCGAYGNCGACGTCGTSGYSLGGAWSGTCPSGDCGIPSTSTPSTSPSPYSGQPVTPPSSSSPSSAPPQTYREEDSDDGFRQPQPIPGTGSEGGGGLLLPEDGASGSNSREAAPAGVAPAAGEAPDRQTEPGGFQFDSYKIPARDQQEGESDIDGREETDDDDEESRVIPPLEIDAVATSVTPLRRRASYRAKFHTPAVARTQVPVHSGWEAIHDVPRLADAAK